MSQKMCVIEEENGNLSVIGCRGFTPSNCIGLVPNSINKADYPYLVKIPIAAAITLAFQAKIKIAPAPKLSEKIKVKIIT